MVAVLIAHRQAVILVAPDAGSRASIDAHPDLAAVGSRLRRYDCASDDIWAQDFGPVTVYAGDHRRFLDFCFDGWGRRYPAGKDDCITRTLFEAGAFGAGDYVRLAQLLEGGSIDGNGGGAILTTHRCLMDNSRNPGFKTSDYEALFAEQLGATRVHWLRHGELLGDDTDGHIDTLARFVSRDTIVYQSCRDPNDAHYRPLDAMAHELAALRDRRNQPYRLLALPLPAARHDPDDGHRLPAGYANFLIANECVLMPAFDDPTDAIAAALLKQCFPERAVVPVDSRAVIRHNGGLHCLAMPIPEARDDE